MAREKGHGRVADHFPGMTPDEIAAELDSKDEAAFLAAQAEHEDLFKRVLTTGKLIAGRMPSLDERPSPGVTITKVPRS